MTDEIRAVDVYRAVLAMTNNFLQKVQGWKISDLRDMENPSLDEIAKQLRLLLKIMRDISDDTYEDKDMEINAFQCLIVMEQIVNAVINGHDDRLPQLMRQLQTHNGAPCH